MDKVNIGSLAWNAFDNYVEALRTGKKERVRRDYMKRLLKKAGRADLQNSWNTQALERARGNRDKIETPRGVVT